MMDNSEFVMIEKVTAVGCYCLEKAAVFQSLTLQLSDIKLVFTVKFTMAIHILMLSQWFSRHGDVIFAWGFDEDHIKNHVFNLNGFGKLKYKPVPNVTN